MKAKFGMIVVAGRGKIGGHVASANRSGAYFRTKVTPVNPQTPAQNEVRSRLGGLSQAWRGLTDAQRAGWTGLVSSFAKTDIFGDIRNPSGINLYQKLNNNLLTIGGSQISEAPQPEDVFTSAILSASFQSGVGLGEIDTAGNIPLGVNVKISATPPISQGRSFVKSEYRLIATPVGDGTPLLEIGPAYLARFGTPPVGSKVFFKIVYVNNTTGQESTLQTIAVTVTA